MWQYNHSNELMHYGKKGMKWGHRKFINDQGEKVKVSKIPLTEKTTTYHKNGSITVEKTTKALIGGSKQTTVNEISKTQMMVGKAAIAATIATYGYVAVKNLSHI